MYNKPIKELVYTYLETFPEENDLLTRCIDQLKRSADITSRKNFVGHCTAASFVYCTGTKRVLLLEHKSLNRFLQPGGHIDAGETPY